MTDPTASAGGGDLVDGIKKGWKWMLFLGILFVILGTVGLAYSVTLTITSVIFFGFLLLFGGGAQIAQAFTAEGAKATFLSLAMAALYLFAGYWTVTHPAAASAALTLLLGWALIFIGVVRTIMAFAMRGREGWFWPLLGGIITIALGIMILNQWPVSALWVIGMFIAIDLILNGWSLITVALAARRLGDAVESAQA